MWQSCYQTHNAGMWLGLSHLHVSAVSLNWRNLPHSLPVENQSISSATFAYSDLCNRNESVSCCSLYMFFCLSDEGRTCSLGAGLPGQKGTSHHTLAAELWGLAGSASLQRLRARPEWAGVFFPMKRYNFLGYFFIPLETTWVGPREKRVGKGNATHVTVSLSQVGFPRHSLSSWKPP